MTTNETNVQTQTSTQGTSSTGDRLRGILVRPEFVTVALLILAFVVGSLMSPYFLDAVFLFNYTSLYIEVGIMAIGMTFIIISGNIDPSVASILALVASAAGVVYFDLGVPMVMTIVIALTLGTLLGWLNGALVARLKLPALAVTLGTWALYRGAAQILVGDDSRPRLAWTREFMYPEWFTRIHRVYIPGTPIPVP